MKINDLNLNSLMFFYNVYQLKSMTKAAEKLFATQSGVSQRILKLERELKTNLFERVNGKLLPTESADLLFKSLSKTMAELNQVLETIEQESGVVSGILRPGVPIEFGNRYILPMLGQFAKKYPLVKFQIRFGHTVGLKEELSNNRLDIAVVDQYHFGSEFYQKVLAREELTLCGHSQYKLPPIQQKLDKLINLPLIDYDEGATLLRQWFKHHFRVKTLKLSLRASAMDVQGIATLIAEGMGIGVLPHKIALERDLFIFKANGPRLINNMSVVYLKKNQSQLVKLFNEFLIHSEK